MTDPRARSPQRPIVFRRVPNPLNAQPCVEIVSHARNRDGYVSIRPRRGPIGRNTGAHRLAYASKFGPIPKGYEVDHICGNRACCNRRHLRLLTVREHKQVTNATRNDARLEEAHCYWLIHQCSGAELARQFGVSPVTGWRWIKQFRADPDA
jgi:hypothetical protein